MPSAAWCLLPKFSSRRGEMNMTNAGRNVTVSSQATMIPAATNTPKTWTDWKIPFLGFRRDVYLGVGAGIAWAEHQVELFFPPRDFSSISDPVVLEAKESKPNVIFTLGGEEYYTPQFSFSWQVGYQFLKFDQLAYTDDSLRQLRDHQSQIYFYSSRARPCRHCRSGFR